MKLSILSGIAVALATTGVWAQDESSNRVAVETDWNVFVESNPTSCWLTSIPKETVNTRDDRVVAVRRGAIQFFVTFVPSNGAKGQVSFTGGYPFAPGSQVGLAVGGQTFQLFTDVATSPEMAWAASTGDDTKIVTALKRGAEAVLTASSARGTKTKDTFSLLGFTAALEEAEKRCS
ncbi:MAG: hypothetical protein KUG69_07100 [Marinosulfonomonas sp.]|nr:hypothetical protein [Marinosulfonomonas sp.]